MKRRWIALCLCVALSAVPASLFAEEEATGWESEQTAQAEPPAPIEAPKPTEPPVPTETPRPTEAPQADGPELPAASETAEIPAAPEKPEATESPAAPEEPEATESPAAPEEPEATESPAEPETPEAPETSAEQEETPAPEDTEVPAEQEETPAPEDTEVPAETAEATASPEPSAEPTETPTPTEAPEGAAFAADYMMLPEGVELFEDEALERPLGKLSSENVVYALEKNEENVLKLLAAIDEEARVCYARFGAARALTEEERTGHGYALHDVVTEAGIALCNVYFLWEETPSAEATETPAPTEAPEEAAFVADYMMLPEGVELFEDEALERPLGKLSSENVVYALEMNEENALKLLAAIDEEARVCYARFGAARALTEEERSGHGYALHDVVTEEGVALCNVYFLWDDLELRAEPTPTPIPVPEWAIAPVITSLEQIGKKTVRVTWTCDGTASSYAVFERTAKGDVRRATSRTFTATISDVGQGEHWYYVVPCRNPQGTLSGGNAGQPSEPQTITTTAQTWRNVGGTTLSQIDWDENPQMQNVGVALSFNDDATATGYQIEWKIGSEQQETLYGDIERDAEGRGEGDALERSNGRLSRSFTVPVGSSCKFRVRLQGVVNDEGDTGYGTWTKWYQITPLRSWSRMPKKLVASRIADGEGYVELKWSFHGRPDAFFIYDGGSLVATVMARTNANEQVYRFPEELSLKTHQFAVQPIMITDVNYDFSQGYGFKKGTKSAVKSLSLSAKQRLSAPKLSAKQTDEGRVRLQWDAKTSVDGEYKYELGEYITVGKKTELTIKGRISASSVELRNITPGKHTYVLRAIYISKEINPETGAPETRETPGPWSGKCSLTVRENVWALAPTNLKATVLDMAGCEIQLTWDAVGKPDAYEILRDKRGEPLFVTADGEARAARFALPKSGTYALYVRAVKTVDGQIKKGAWSAVRSVNIKKTNQPATKYRALVIGNTYPGTSLQLNGPDKDAAGMRSMLATMGATAYDITLRNNRTASQIRSDIDEVFAGASAADVSLFFFAGHGETGTGNLLGTGGTKLTFAQLRSSLDQIPGKKIVILDSCYSGNAINRAASVSQAELEQWASQAASAFAQKGRSGELASGDYYVMTACSMAETSVTMGGVGLFTYALLSGCGWDEVGNRPLSTLAADADGNRMITLNEAYRSACATVDKLRAGNEKILQASKVYPTGSSFVLWGK